MNAVVYAGRIVGLLEAVRDRLAALSRVVAPLGDRARDISSGAVRFGPFAPGDLVRITATGNAWFLFGDASVTAEVGNGLPLGKWDRHDFEVVHRGDGDHVSVCVDTSEAAGIEGGGVVYAAAFRSGHVKG